MFDITILHRRAYVILYNTPNVTLQDTYIYFKPIYDLKNKIFRLWMYRVKYFQSECRLRDLDGPLRDSKPKRVDRCRAVNWISLFLLYQQQHNQHFFLFNTVFLRPLREEVFVCVWVVFLCRKLTNSVGCQVHNVSPGYCKCFVSLLYLPQS